MYEVKVRTAREALTAAKIMKMIGEIQVDEISIIKKPNKQEYEISGDAGLRTNWSRLPVYTRCWYPFEEKRYRFYVKTVSDGWESNQEGRERWRKYARRSKA